MQTATGNPGGKILGPAIAASWVGLYARKMSGAEPALGRCTINGRLADGGESSAIAFSLAEPARVLSVQAMAPGL